MIIIELKINNHFLTVSELYVEKVNHLLVLNYNTLYYFLNNFFNSQEAQIFLGNYKIDYKSAYIINLLDYESISNQLILKKGTILYDYLIDETISKIEDTYIEEELEIQLKKLIEEVMIDKTLEYETEFNIDISKIVTNYIHFKMDLSIENYIKSIKKLIINLKNKNLKKSIIIFINTNIFGNDLDDLEGVIIFKLYSKNFPNIIVNNNVENIEKQILINQIKLNWPCEIENKIIYEIVENFAKDVSINKEIYTDDYMKYVGYILISKILQLNIDCQLTNYDTNKIPSCYINFIKSL
ncbi:MAG: hypothetical protein HPY96_06765 [Bacilli bacterium]|nr:hypothetical protein [Bacilli bacterium]